MIFCCYPLEFGQLLKPCAIIFKVFLYVKPLGNEFFGYFKQIKKGLQKGYKLVTNVFCHFLGKNLCNSTKIKPQKSHNSENEGVLSCFYGLF